MAQKGWIKTLQFICLAVLAAGITLCCLNFHTPCHKKDVHSYTSYTRAQEQYITSTTQSLKDLLEPLVGYGKVKVVIQATFNIKKQHSTQHEIIPDSAVIKQQTVIIPDITKDLQSQPYQTQIDYTYSSKDTQTTNTFGVVEKQHISVVIDGNTRAGDKGIYQARTNQEMAYYTDLIKSAVGFNALRGDTLEVLNIPFSSNRTTPPVSWIDLVKFCAIFAFLYLIFISVFILIRSEKNEHTKALYPSDLSNLQLIQNTLETNIHIPVSVIKNWIYMPEQKNNDWTGTQKVSILLLAVGDKSVRRILTHLNDDEVKQITKTMASLGIVTAKQAERVFAEFYQAMQGNTNLVGNQARVHQILTDSMAQNVPPHTNPELWKKLSPMDPHVLAEYLQALPPEISAFVLYCQDAAKAAQIIPFFQKFYATQVLTHLAHIGHVSLASHYKLEKQAEEAVKNILDRAQIQAGDKKVSEILKHMEKNTESDLISALYQQSPDWADKISFHLIRFNDISKWPDEAVRTLLRHVSKKTAITALTGADANMMDTIARNIPPQIWAEIQPQIQDKNTASNTQIQQAQDAVVSIARTLWAQKKIHL